MKNKDGGEVGGGGGGGRLKLTKKKRGGLFERGLYRGFTVSIKGNTEDVYSEISDNM